MTPNLSSRESGNPEDTGVASKRKEFDLRSYYQVYAQVSFDLEYSWPESKYRRPVDGFDEVPGALSDVFTGGVSLSLRDNLEAALRVRHFEDYALDAGEKADGSTLLNLRLSYTPTENFSITADLLNLLDSNDHDVEYYYESQLANEAAPVADHHYHVFEPRSLRLYLTYSF